MAVSAGTAALQVVPTLTKDFSRSLVSQMAGPAVKGSEKAGREHGRRFGTSFSGGIRTGVGPVRSIIRGFGPGLAAAFGATALVAGIKSVTDEARESAKVGKQTAAVLKSTGGVAGVSAKQIGNLAQSISNAVGVDDELIQSGENWLLTFKNVRDEAGKGNDVFTRASKSAVDLAASMHQGEVSASGLHSANTLLGKALNDPIRGMTALGKAGVTFNDQQKEQIKTLVKSGDTLGAQKIILGEVESQTKGFAAASTDSGKRFSVFVANLKENIGNVLLPAMNKLLGFLVDNLPKAFAAVGEASRKVVGWFQRAGQVASRILGPALASIAESVVPAAKAFTEALLPGLKSLWHVVQTQVFPAIKVLAAIIGVALFAALKYVLPLLLRIAGPVLGFLFKQLGQTIQWISNVIRWIGRVGAWLLRWITGTKDTGAALIKLGLNTLKVFKAIFNVIAGTVVNILHIMGKLPGPMGAPFRKAEEAARKAKQTVNTQMDALQARINKLKGKKIPVEAVAKITLEQKTKTALLALGIKGYGTKFLAEGGRLPGYGGGDRIPAMLEAGEAVVPKHAVRDPGFQQWAKEKGIPGFQSGGLVGLGGRAAGKLGGLAAAKLADVVGDALGKIVGKLGGGSAAIKAFIRSVDPLPYIWGASGPGGYDCSGLVSAVYGKMTGRGGGHGQRYFTTATIGASGGLKPGLGGVLQIGVRPGHHMAGRYGGLGFEAESSRTGIKIGAAASTPESFPVRYHMARGGRIDAALVNLLGRTADVGGDPGGLTINGQTFDRGGTLSPGLNLLANRTGRPEPLVPAGQGIDYDRLGRAVARALAEQPPRVYLDPAQARHGIRESQRAAGVPKDRVLR